MIPCPETHIAVWRWIDDVAPLVLYTLTLWQYARIAYMRFSFPQWVHVWRWHAGAVLAYALGRGVVVADAMGWAAPYAFEVRNWLVVLAAGCLWQGAWSLRKVLRDAGAAR